jgi:hypothetical protein
VSRRGVSFTVTCNGPSGKNCPGIATLVGHERLRRGRVIGVIRHSKPGAKNVTLGKASFSPPAGTSATVRLPLNATGRRLLGRFHLLPSTLTVGVAGKTISRSVVFKA